METIAHFLSQQPFLALFLVIALGYAIGSINIKGFALGVGAVIFSGLLIGYIAPKAQPPAMVGTLGLVMFLYGLGVQFGRQFFEGLAGAAGRRYNLLMVLSLAAASAITVAEMVILRVRPSMMAGLFAGSGTSAATMQAAIEAAKNNDPAIGYSVAFPFGLIGAILCMYFMQLVVKPNTEATSGVGIETVEVTVRSVSMIGRNVEQVMSTLPAGVKILLVRAGEENKHPDPGLILRNGDVLMLAGSDRISLDRAREMIGEHAPGRITADRSKVDYVRVFMSKSSLVGRRVSDLKLPVVATIMHVQRGDTAMLVTPDLTFELGDRVGLLTNRKEFQTVRKFFGDSIRSTTEFSYISLGIGMMVGVLLGITPIPVPGLGTMKIGLAGGSLVAALVLGRLGRTWKLTWTMPLSANLTLRNFGLSIFLAQVGMSSGTPFVSLVRDSGVIFLVAGALMVFALALTPLLIGHYVMRIPFDDLLGITSGVTGTPAILAYAYRSFPSERVEICYAMIYPAATILKIVIAQLLIAVGSGG